MWRDIHHLHLVILGQELYQAPSLHLCKMCSVTFFLFFSNWGKSADFITSSHSWQIGAWSSWKFCFSSVIIFPLVLRLSFYVHKKPLHIFFVLGCTVFIWLVCTLFMSCSMFSFFLCPTLSHTHTHTHRWTNILFHIELLLFSHINCPTAWCCVNSCFCPGSGQEPVESTPSPPAFFSHLIDAFHS